MGGVMAHYRFVVDGGAARYTLESEPPEELIIATRIFFYDLFRKVGADKPTAEALVKVVAASIFFVGPKVSIKTIGRYYENMTGKSAKSLSIFLARAAKRSKIIKKRRAGVYLISRGVVRKIISIAKKIRTSSTTAVTSVERCLVAATA